MGLPSGWEKRLTPESRPYYVNHNQRTTAWTMPTEDPNLESLPLPPGWEMRNTSSQRVYFINNNDRTTTWQDPRQTVVTGSTSVDRASVQPELAKDLGPLPKGWEKCVSMTGAVYFLDHNTRTSLWEDPRMQRAKL